MALGRGARLGLGIFGVAGLLAAGVLALVMAPGGPAGRGDDADVGGAGAASAGAQEGRPVPGFSGRAALLAGGDAEALAGASAEVAPAVEADGEVPAAPASLSDAELATWLDDLAGIGAGFSRFGPVDRARVIATVGTVLDRLAVEPAPARWIETLSPSAEVLTVGLADASPAVRAGAAEVLGRAWDWQPGCSTWPDADRAVASWKNRLHTPMVALLDDPEPGVRLSAVLALGRLPIDAMAQPATALLDDPVPAVRVQLLNSFAHRRDLMTDEAILPLLFDPESAVALAAQIVLRARGLDDDQISLAKLLFHPRAEIRASAIAMVEAREDIDPIVWLLRLSRDEDEAVRSQALDALSRRTSPDARRRLAEMADSDPSESIRDAARRALDELTADLPPLPSSSGTSIRAN
ncbi:HEAT repeat domain-containing protein [Tautonia plasticadhaerens]|uniref:HEAT repeat protein n=1 Tax=Tautonia plasticadhaerens TaxID=2527974 RepID=A0A518GXG1_9BACT|nr:HEAT repeat domain-containing protein [Tautonia plasticadhaerens]QDV33286.1 HEAT repeat protein [Tautonia plasticadhaerens]